MDEEGKKRIIDAYVKDVKWLREHVPPDDIYDFAQQALMASDYLLWKLDQFCDVAEETETDEVLCVWIKNIIMIGKMKDTDFKGIINTAWRVE